MKKMFKCMNSSLSFHLPALLPIKCFSILMRTFQFHWAGDKKVLCSNSYGGKNVLCCVGLGLLQSIFVPDVKLLFFSEALLSCQNIRFFWRIFRIPADYHSTQESKLGLCFAVLQQLQKICAKAQVHSAIIECPYRVKQGVREFCSAASCNAGFTSASE